jgi:hypothetical protein
VKKKMMTLAVPAGVVLLAFLALTAPHVAAADTVNGTLMDMACATGRDAKSADSVAKHDKTCLLMDGCVASGYAVVTSDLQVVKLDATGNDAALKLIKATDRVNDWKVTVVGTRSGDTIAVSSLSLR